MSRVNGMIRKDAGTAYVRSGALTSSQPLLKRIRPNAKLASDPISTVRNIVIRPMKKLLPNWCQKSSERPGQNVDGEQGLDPPAATHEEAGQQQGQEHLHVHAEANVQRRVDDRPRVERVGD